MLSDSVEDFGVATVKNNNLGLGSTGLRVGKTQMLNQLCFVVVVRC